MRNETKRIKSECGKIKWRRKPNQIIMKMIKIKFRFFSTVLRFYVPAVIVRLCLDDSFQDFMRLLILI